MAEGEETRDGGPVRAAGGERGRPALGLLLQPRGGQVHHLLPLPRHRTRLASRSFDFFFFLLLFSFCCIKQITGRDRAIQNPVR